MQHIFIEQLLCAGVLLGPGDQGTREKGESEVHNAPEEQPGDQ